MMSTKNIISLSLFLLVMIPGCRKPMEESKQVVPQQARRQQQKSLHHVTDLPTIDETSIVMEEIE